MVRLTLRTICGNFINMLLNCTVTSSWRFQLSTGHSRFLNTYKTPFQRRYLFNTPLAAFSKLFSSLSSKCEKKVCIQLEMGLYFDVISNFEIIFAFLKVSLWCVIDLDILKWHFAMFSTKTNSREELETPHHQLDLIMYIAVISAPY